MGGQDFNPDERRAKRRRNDLIMKYIISVLLLIIIVMVLVLIRVAVIPEIRKITSTSELEEGNGFPEDDDDAGTEQERDSFEPGMAAAESEADSQDQGIKSVMEQSVEAVREEADQLAAMYDYDGAIATVQSCDYYDSSEELQSAVTGYVTSRDACISWQPDEVTHIFFHTIIWDPAKAFDGDQDAEGYNQYMVTMNEFSAIMQIMYEEGYVMVSMHDICEISDDGSVSRKSILLPEGKKPFVLSQDDVCYYHYMNDDGFAQKLVLDENGEVKCSYTDEDGSVSTGDFDLIPWIDTFVKEHPDFSYHGHKGIIALTGYEGVLGYRTDEVYRTRDEERMTSWQKTFLEETPDFDWQADVDAAKEVASAIKANGWEFANHTWGHIDPLERGYEATVQDTERWLENVAPIVGDTDIIVFAFGADISNWEEYSSENEYFNYLKGEGYNIFCNVDSSVHWVQFNGTSMRMGRRDIDGYRMYYNPELLSDLFDVSEVWDDARPPVVEELDEAAGTAVLEEK